VDDRDRIAVLIEYALGTRRIAQVNPVVDNSLSCDPLDAVQDALAGAGVIVDRNRVEPGRQQLDQRVATDVAAAAGDYDL